MLSEGSDTQLSRNLLLCSLARNDLCLVLPSQRESTCDFVSVFRGAREGSAIMTKTFRRLPERRRARIRHRLERVTNISLALCF